MKILLYLREFSTVKKNELSLDDFLCKKLINKKQSHQSSKHISNYSNNQIFCTFEGNNESKHFLFFEMPESILIQHLTEFAYFVD